jgi:Asp-tRNA(Asn)/Glu-tRNA(Gln) amidotransferase A subunit family amidase
VEQLAGVRQRHGRGELAVTTATSGLHALSATELLALYRRGEVSPVEVTRAVLACIERCEPLLHATWALDAEAALAMARASEARWARGEPLALDGVPVTIKENIATRGVAVPLGTAATELAREVRGLRIGLWLDAGWGLALDAEVRAVVEAAARAFEAAGAIVEPLAPFTTRAMADGIDRFWRLRSWLDIAALPEARRARVLPFIVDWARGGADASGEQVYRGWYQMHAMREATVAATQRFDFVLSPVSPVPGFPAEWPMPSNDAAHSLEHIAFTVPANMSEQPAASVNAGYTARGMPVGLQIIGRRFDDLGVLQLAHAWERLRPAQRDWPAVSA